MMTRLTGPFVPQEPSGAIRGATVLGIDPTTSLPGWVVAPTARGLALNKGLQIQNGAVAGSGFTASSGGSTADVSTSHSIAAVRKTTGASTGSTAYEQSLVEAGCLAHAPDYWFAWRSPSDLTLQRLWAGVTNAATLPTADTFSTSVGAGFRRSTAASDTNIQFQTSTGAALNTTDTGIAYVASHDYFGRFWSPDRGTTIYWSLSDLTAGTTATGSTTTAIPASTTQFRMGILTETRTNATRDFVFYGVNALTRLAT